MIPSVCCYIPETTRGDPDNEAVFPVLPGSARQQASAAGTRGGSRKILPLKRDLSLLITPAIIVICRRIGKELK